MPAPGAVAGQPAVPSASPSLDVTDTPFGALVREFFPFHDHFDPLDAATSGRVPLEARLPDMSAEGRMGLAAAYGEWLSRLDDPDVVASTGPDHWDRLLLRSELEYRILRLSEMKDWTRDPTIYLDVILHALLESSLDPTLPPATRARLLAERARPVPGLLAEAARNLENPPAILIERALAEGSKLRLLLDAGPEVWVDGLTDGPDLWAARDALIRVSATVATFLDRLETQVLPAADGDEALGAPTLVALLTHGAPFPPPRAEDRDLLDTLLAESVTDLERATDRAHAVAGEVDASRAPGEVLRYPFGAAGSVGAAGGREEEEVVERILSDIRAWVRVAALLPDPERLPAPRVRTLLLPTTPGGPGGLGGIPPFGASAPLDPRLLITVSPDVALPLEVQLESILLLHGPGGRLVLEDALRSRVIRPVRKAFPSRFLAAGWPLHAWGALVDEGYGRGTVMELLLERERTRAFANFHAALALHSGAWTSEQVDAFLVDAAWLTPPQARAARARIVANPLEALAGPADRAIQELVDVLSAPEDASPAMVRGLLLETAMPPWMAARVLPALLGRTGEEISVGVGTSPPDGAQ